MSIEIHPGPGDDSVPAGSRDIIKRLRAFAIPGQVPACVELADAEAAVQAAADTRTREIVDALTEQARAIPLGDRSEDSYNTAIRMVREVARRFPVSDCDTTSTNEAAGETPTSATPDR